MISDVAAVATALATAVLAVLTFVLARATKNLADQTSRPFCVLTFEGSAADAIAINQIVRNTGTATAFDIAIRLTPSLEEISDVRSVKGWKSVSVLPPGAAVGASAGTSRALHDKEFEVEVSWSNSPSSNQRDSVKYLCCAVPQSNSEWRVKGTHHLVEQVEKLRGEIAAVGQSLIKANRE